MKKKSYLSHMMNVFFIQMMEKEEFGQSQVKLPLRKKGNGRSIMVSKFLTEAYGRLCLSDEQVFNHRNIPKEARVYLQPEKNQEGYWTSEHLINQVETKAILIFEAIFPNCIGL